MKRLLLVITIVLFLVAPVFAEDVEKYGIDDLIQSIYNNNTKIRKADEDVVQAHLDTKDAEAGYQPTIELTLMGMYMANPFIDDITINTNDILMQMGMAPIPQSYDITLFDGIGHTFYNASISITQPLLTWGKITNSVKLFKAAESAREMQRDDLGNQLVTELKARLAALVYLSDIEELLGDVITTSDELVSLAEKGSEEGMILEEDVLDAKIQAGEADVSLKEIEKQKAMLVDGIRVLTGIPDLEAEDISYEVDESEFDAILSCPLDSLVALAVSPSSPALQMLDKSCEAMEYAKKIADASMYGIPDLGLQLSLNYGGTRFPLLETGWTGEDDWGLNVTVAFKTTLWDGGKILNNVKRAESRIRSNDIDRDSAIEALTTNVTDAFTSAELSAAKIEYQELKLENGERKAENEKMRFDAGSSSRSGILQNELDMLQDHIELITEKMNLAQNCYTLYYLINRISDSLPLISDGGTV